MMSLRDELVKETDADIRELVAKISRITNQPVKGRIEVEFDGGIEVIEFSGDKGSWKGLGHHSASSDDAFSVFPEFRCRAIQRIKNLAKNLTDDLDKLGRLNSGDGR